MPKKNGKKSRAKIPRNRFKTNQLAFKRSYFSEVSQNSPGGVNLPTAGNYWFSLSLLSGISEITNMFQKVYIMSVDVEWLPKATVSQTSAINTNSTTLLYAFNGNNDQTGLPSYSSMMENSMTKFGLITKGFKIRIFPVVKSQMGSQGVVTYYSQKPSRTVAMDGNSLGLRHYGIDWFVPDTNLAGGTILGSLKQTYNILGKNVR